MHLRVHVYICYGPVYGRPMSIHWYCIEIAESVVKQLTQDCCFLALLMKYQ